MTHRAHPRDRAGRAAARRVPAALATIVALALALVAPGASATDEVHGTSDAFAGNGVAIAWAALRGASEETTQVVVRVAFERGRFARVALEGVDPFTKERKPGAAPRAVAEASEFRIARKAFADFPRTEFLFFAAQSAPGAPAGLVVYYLGVPDTTPEFPTEGALDAYLADRLATLRKGGAK